MKPKSILTDLKDYYGMPLYLGDIVEDDGAEELSPWKFHYVEKTGKSPPEIRDFNAHNIGMILEGKYKRVGAWNDPNVIERLIKYGQHKSAKEIEEDVWELMSKYDYTEEEITIPRIYFGSKRKK